MSLTQLTASRELLWNLTLRELRTKYRRSFLGWAWSLLNPLATVAIYGFVFGTIFGATPPLGDPSGVHNYSLYLLCALLPWNFFGMVTGTGMSALVANAGLVRKVAFPRETLVFAQVLHGLVQHCIEMSLLAVVLVAFGSPLLPWLPLTIFLMVTLAMFSAGVALILSAVGVYFRDMAYLWSILVQIWFFATPIVYPATQLEGKVPRWVQRVLEYNPMAQFAEGFRHTLYDARGIGVLNALALLAAAAASLTIGWWVFGRLSRRFAEEL
jgi:ABC-type polysaccharide/polyol phosphate export permease